MISPSPKFRHSSVAPDNILGALGFSDMPFRKGRNLLPISPTQLYLNKVFQINLSRATLQRLAALCESPKNIALVGWSDYAKHLVNLFGDKIACIADDRGEVADLEFRGVRVVPLNSPEVLSADCFVLTRYEMLNITSRFLYNAGLFPKRPYLYAEEYDGQTTDFYKPMDHDGIFEQIRSAGTPPPTMMEDSRIVLLIETLKTAMRLPGDVVEVGAWQGGSAWYICQALRAMMQERDAFIFDFFDDADPMSGRAIMSSEQIRRQLSFYDKARVIVGDACKTISALKDRKIAFFHYDNMFQKIIFPYVWERMPSGGIILLDNYGHFRSHPAMLDDFAEQNGTRVTFIPPLGQGLLIKP